MNQPLKALIKNASLRHQDANPADYAAGKYSIVGNKRVLLTHLVTEAWDELHQRYGHTIVSTFRRLGLSLNPDASEDTEILIKGLDALEIGDWTLPEMETQEAEAAVAMPLSSEAKAQRAQDKKKAAALRTALQQARLVAEGEEEGRRRCRHSG